MIDVNRIKVLSVKAETESDIPKACSELVREYLKMQTAPDGNAIQVVIGDLHVPGAKIVFLPIRLVEQYNIMTDTMDNRVELWLEKP